MFIDQLSGFSDRVEEDRECIEAADHAAQLDATDKVDRDADIFFSDLV